MGSRDVRHRESKKAKKDKKKSPPPVLVAAPVAEPEVTRKKRPIREEP